jgi:hypothetical protein
MTSVDHHHEAIVFDAPELKKEPLLDVGLAVVGIDVTTDIVGLTGMAVVPAAVAAKETDGMSVGTGAGVTGWGVVGTGARDVVMMGAGVELN